MMKPFEYIEVLEASKFNTDTSVFDLTATSTPKVALLRGIVGSMRLRHTVSKVEFQQNIDYLDLEERNVSKPLFDKLKDYISEDLSVEDLCRILRNRTFAYQNQKFYENLNQEFNNFYYYEGKGSHTTAFAFVYRILETISYAFPLIYAAKTNDFKGTYDLLKSYLTGSKDKGELGFFKSFIKVLFGGDPVSESSITIEITGEDEDIQKAFFNSFKKACPDDRIYDATDTEEPRKLSIKFSEYSSFIISIRNRFFHFFNSGQPNLESDDILDADAFFALINKKSIHWISFVLFEVFKYNIDSETRI